MSDHVHVFDMMPAQFKNQQRWRTQIVSGIYIGLIALALIAAAVILLTMQIKQREAQLLQLQQQDQALNLKNETLMSKLAQRKALQQQAELLRPSSDASEALTVSAELGRSFDIWFREWHWRQNSPQSPAIRLQAIAPSHGALSSLLSRLNQDKRISSSEIVESRLATDVADQAVYFELLSYQAELPRREANP